MAKISIVNSVYVKSEGRLDAEAFDEKYLHLISVCNTKSWRELREFLIKVNRGVLVTATNIKSSFFYIKTKDIDGLFVNLKELANIQKEDYEKNKKAQIKEGDILLNSTGVGSICRPAIWLYPNIKAIVDNHVTILRTNDKLPSEYLFVFLSSKFGQLQLEKKVRGATGQIELYKEDIKSVRIFLPENSKLLHKITDMVRTAFQKHYLAEQKYRQAEELLYQLLGISREEIEKLEAEKAYETNFKEVKHAFRFDTEYYHPKYIGVIELLKKTPFEVKPLKEAVKISNEKIDPTKEPYESKRFKYVPIAKINESGEIFEWEEFYGWQAPSRARMLIRKGDILIPSLSGTFDKIALVPEELDGQLATTGCFVVRVEERYPEFLFLLFRSPLFKRQLDRLTTGAIMSAVPKTIFGSLLVPAIPEDEQEQIAHLVREYLKLRKEARQLIQKAIGEVEEQIENASRSNGE